MLPRRVRVVRKLPSLFRILTRRFIAATEYRRDVARLIPRLRRPQSYYNTNKLDCSPSQTSRIFQQASTFSSKAQQQGDLTEITVTTSSGQEVAYIRRSYPKGKPEKLITGLHRLLSSAAPVTDTSKAQHCQWALSSSNDAIYLACTLSNSDTARSVIEAISKEADGLGHHPHIAHEHCEKSGQVVLVVTCTTHMPQGLSLKDVKLAERVGASLDGVAARKEGAVGQVGGSEKSIVDRLIQDNEGAAERARSNPDSACAKG